MEHTLAPDVSAPGTLYTLVDASDFYACGSAVRWIVPVSPVRSSLVVCQLRAQRIQQYSPKHWGDLWLLAGGCGLVLENVTFDFGSILLA